MVRSRTYIAVPPGATIKEQLDIRGMSQKEFAVRTGYSEKHISKLINGTVELTPEMAVRLEMVLGVPAKFWNGLEALYREKLIKVKEENAMEEEAKIAGQFPYAEMVKAGWVPAAGKITEKVISLRKFFEVADLSLLEHGLIPRIAYRKLTIRNKDDLASVAWVQKVKLMAREIPTAPIDLKGLIEAIPEIRRMTVMEAEEFSPLIKKCLADHGIALVFLPGLKGSFLEGAAFKDGNKIVVGLADRGKYAEEFWFGLFHELAHIVLGHTNLPEGTTKEEEKAADQWAADLLIPV